MFLVLTALSKEYKDTHLLHSYILSMNYPLIVSCGIGTLGLVFWLRRKMAQLNSDLSWFKAESDRSWFGPGVLQIPAIFNPSL